MFMSGVEGVGDLIARFHLLSQTEMTDEVMRSCLQVQHEIEAQNGWMLSNRVDAIVQRLSLPADAKMKSAIWWLEATCPTGQSIGCRT